MLLGHKGYETFLPLAPANAQGRARLQRVLFPGYLFCRPGENACGRVVSTPGVVRIVGMIESTKIVELRRIVDSGVKAKAWPVVELGVPIEITRGPLRGCRGVYRASREGAQILIEVTLLQRSVCVEIGAHDFRPVSEADPVLPRKQVSSDFGSAPTIAVNV